MIRPILLVAANAAFSVIAVAQTSDVQTTEDKLVKAREAYATAISAIRNDVLKIIAAKDAAERKRPNPDLNKLKELKAEKSILEQRGEMPKWIDAKTKNRSAKARASLIIALIEMKAAYVQNNSDEKAEIIEKEVEHLTKRLEPDATDNVVALLISTKWIHDGAYKYTFSDNGTVHHTRPDGTLRHGKYAPSKDRKTITLWWDDEPGVGGTIYTDANPQAWKMNNRDSFVPTK